MGTTTRTDARTAANLQTTNQTAPLFFRMPAQRILLQVLVWILCKPPVIYDHEQNVENQDRNCESNHVKLYHFSISSANQLVTLMVSTFLNFYVLLSSLGITQPICFSVDMIDKAVKKKGEFAGDISTKR